MSSSVKLDHIGVAIKDLERGRQAYDRLGFKLTPRSIHRGSPTPGAPVVPFGSGNHCAMFHEGYLEVVGLVDPTIFSNIKPMVARYEGAHIVAFGVESADATYQELAARGIPIEPARQLERDAAYGPQNDQLKRAAFRNIFSRDDSWPEARYLVIEHQTPEFLWQPRYQRHPNGACDLVAVTFVADDPSTLIPRLTALGAAPVAGKGATISARLPGRGSINIRDSTLFAETYGYAPHSGLQAITVSFSDLEQTLALFKSRSVAVTTSREGLWIASRDANGFVLHLVQDHGHS